MRTIDTATKMIALLAIIDEKKQGTYNIEEKPFQWHVLQMTIIARLPSAIPFNIHDLVKIACRATFGVCIVGMTVHCGGSSTIKVWDITEEAPSIAILSYFLSEQRRCGRYGTKFFVILAVDCCAIKIKNDRCM